MAKTYILLGGNLGNRENFLHNAIVCLEKTVGKIVSKSSIYESEPWGFETENWFLNQVVLIDTNLKPSKLLLKTQEIEKQLGRIKKSKEYETRKIDIDILFYDFEIIENPNLTIPHKHLHKRMFTLLPLLELSPKLIHPVFSFSIKELMEKCGDKSIVRKI
ncbi:MAG: 2-amino-4-hydroxy-6-hydroxymethyldihydropteridine diphosphokinase [Bacteroidetes bacterium]|jgi:2-amino-4-hydroxy-6-hydroxymethyldihydropteridine diphosphokinase|nr:2-amino-4-hydroxy-6-hydroxymethyldihydropteridine diphosphokinase [Bacteroidota bacterium]MBT6687656.1 2-amino-4-hydroxy-6-hydroxymethyldihydropteridine diphosphokinase [Bacteroidota bacterium]MBT7142851.1 2-amino-4-hydroxy-6-hydroxymethyldihydropteridine diphosphokinase [Bacteroidota bacterium]MBT7492583.1 2-amino-4-hydroxy-6-hydroxymethyldihydropteridine diphosphokinase [Bacteroidota bacterium]